MEFPAVESFQNGFLSCFSPAGSEKACVIRDAVSNSEQLYEELNMSAAAGYAGVILSQL
jgi:hypothetical protein